MTLDNTHCGDILAASAGYRRDNDTDSAFVRGWLSVEVHGPDGELKSRHIVDNMITRVGEQRYAEAGALGDSGATVAAPTGMQLGTGTTAPAKTGSGSSITAGNVVANSLVPFAGTPTSSIPSSVRRITYVANWAAGVATANGISEVALVNQATGTQTAAPATATLARAILSPSVNKSSADSLSITWHHEVGTAS